MLIQNLHLSSTKIKSALALLIRMMWDGLFVNEVLDLTVGPKSNLGRVQSNVNVIFSFISKACARGRSWLLRCLKVSFLGLFEGVS